jgi:alkylation response protein AidB-like acyl-CoA dehydrogenase
MLEIYASELIERLARTALDLLGPGASLRPCPDAALIAGRFEHAVLAAQLYTIGGVTNGIQRTLIATRGLNLPR